MADEKVKVLFVCLGNICRSPLAENVFRHYVEAAGLSDHFEIDSAGTSAYHIGDPPDQRTTAVARARGIELSGAARQIKSSDLATFDYVIAMDSENFSNIRTLSTGTTRAEIERLRHWDPDATADHDVPDPYYGGARGFENVQDIIERSCRGLLAHIRAEHSL